jgi:hypothetical protein
LVSAFVWGTKGREFESRYPDQILGAIMYDDPDYGDNVCQVCGKSDDTVYERACGYSMDINGTEVLEMICDDCEGQHCDDI